MLDYDGNVEEDLIMPFQASIEEYGRVITHDLKPGGKSQIVSNANRHEFVKLYLASYFLYRGEFPNGKLHFYRPLSGGRSRTHFVTN